MQALSICKGHSNKIHDETQTMTRTLHCVRSAASTRYYERTDGQSDASPNLQLHQFWQLIRLYRCWPLLFVLPRNKLPTLNRHPHPLKRPPSPSFVGSVIGSCYPMLLRGEDMTLLTADRASPSKKVGIGGAPDQRSRTRLQHIRCFLNDTKHPLQPTVTERVVLSRSCLSASL